MRSDVARRYEEMAQAGDIVPDDAQRSLAMALDRLVDRLVAHGQRSKGSSLGWLFSRGEKPAPLRGLYIWGGVGTGKTMLMDWFFRAAPAGKRRVHFHEFMDEVHQKLDLRRQRFRRGEVDGEDPIPPVAAEIAADLRLLCFDEFAVEDIADAMILGRLFQHLFARRLIVVATSNTPPDRLYENGLNRDLFLPFIALMEEHMEVFHLDAARDYRLDRHGAGPLYVTPLGPEADKCLNGQFRRLSGTERGVETEIANKGRVIPVPESADGVARFSFKDLCARPLGASDYLRIAERFHTVVLADVPVLDAGSRNEARRFINLIDTLYDEGVRLVASAEAEPDQLWRGDAGAEGFAFGRTASRLAEMRSEEYWTAHSPRADAGARERIA